MRTLPSTPQFRSKIVLFLTFALCAAFLGCSPDMSSSSSSSEKWRYELVRSLVEKSDAILLQLIPNDSMPGDTLLAHLGSGVFAWTNPGVHYVLEVESSEAEMELNRFQSVGRKVYTSPRVNEGVCDGKVCRFEFDGGSSLQSWFFALSVENGRKPAPKSC